jgi:transcriptional regulator with GAF, ATPase, and Fis domain
LDEIGDMPLASQAKILRVLQDGSFERLGGNEVVKVNIRVIAATNKELDDENKKNNFREDLFYRLSTFILKIPPLRERGQDIQELTDYFIKYFSQEYQQPVPVLTDEFKSELKKYPWPGNVRQLRHAIHRAVVIAKGSLLTKDHLILDENYKDSPVANELENELDEKLDSLFQEVLFSAERLNGIDIMDLMQKAVLKRVLQIVDYKQTQAAALLNMSRTTLQKKIKEFGLQLPKNQ